MCGSLRNDQQWNSNLYKLQREEVGRRGATNVIDCIRGDMLTASVRVYPDGVRVGCTFVTKEALKVILPQIAEIVS